MDVKYFDLTIMFAGKRTRVPVSTFQPEGQDIIYRAEIPGGEWGDVVVITKNPRTRKFHYYPKRSPADTVAENIKQKLITENL
jgi:hypothetical protein